MHLRIIRVTPQAGQTEELSRRWQAFWESRFPTVAGFQHAYIAVDRESGTIAAVSLFERQPDLKMLGSLAQEFRASVQDIAGELPEIRDYEVLADI
jgi:hypothetical protein